MTGRNAVFLFGLLLFLSIVRVGAQTSAHSPFIVVSYNCENLFDCRHDTLKDDHEFLPEGQREWNFGKLWKKLNGIGRVIVQSGSADAEHGSYYPVDSIDIDRRYWRLPDIVALVEVENDSVMRMLTRQSLLKTAGYRYVMTNSADVRGVDVAMMYNPLSFRLLDHYAIRIATRTHQRPTRDILYAKGMAYNGDTLHVFVVHSPSRSGGKELTDKYRMTIAQRLVASVDSIRLHAGTAAEQHIIIAGDFNDYSRDKSIKYIKGNGLAEVSEKAVGRYHPIITGTYKYQGQWDSLDHIFLSQSLSKRRWKCFILDAPWMLTKDSKAELKPYRTFLGTFYSGGISDHLPLVLVFE